MMLWCPARYGIDEPLHIVGYQRDNTLRTLRHYRVRHGVAAALILAADELG